MKKISIFMGVMALVLGFTSCKNDADPVFQAPTEFVLNTPPMADQLYVLTPDGSLTFTCSQPNYGFTASTTYGVQVALTEDGPTYTVPAQEPTSAKIRVKAEDVAIAITALKGIEEEKDWVDYASEPLYVRATAQLGTHASSFITSNWIQLKQVKAYFAVVKPGFIYIVGNVEGWKGPDEANADHYANWRLYEKESAIGSKVYYGVFDMPADPIFRFYTALTGWDADSWGSQKDDSPLPYSFKDGPSLTEKLVSGKGSFEFPNFAGGEMTLIVDMSTEGKEKVTFIEGNQM